MSGVETATIINTGCIEAMRAMPESSVDAIVTDPPYGLGFMGKEWDNLPPGLDFAVEALRVLKPGGHLLAFGGTRTWHRLAVAIEDAGFEIRDSIAWMYGSGFPKSMDVSKAIDKAAGATREVVGQRSRLDQASKPAHAFGYSGPMREQAAALDITAPATDAARQWQGWGTALKPAFEPIVVARKPLLGTVAANVLAYGTGALNIDASRVGSEERPKMTRTGNITAASSMSGRSTGSTSTGEMTNTGRFPANVILDESQAAALDEQSGTLKSGARKAGGDVRADEEGWRFRGGTGVADIGGASRFFYCAKAPKSERPVVDGVAHPTVKPLALMRYLVRLVTPASGVVLDPFAGSGTTVEAALLEGFRVVGIERETAYLPLIEARITRATAAQEAATTAPVDLALFDDDIQEAS